MEKIVFIEVLDRWGRVQERVRADSFPATIGRAYSNRVIIDDRHVDPGHARIAMAEDGVLYLEDLNSVNGLHLVKPAKRVERIAVNPDLRVRIGQTMLRFRFEDHAVLPAIVDRTAEDELPAFAGNPFILGTLLFAGMAWLVLLSYLGSSRYTESADILIKGVATLIAFGAWAGLWSFASRLLAQRFRYLTHLSFAVTTGAVFMALATSHDYVEFVVSPGVVTIAAEFAIIAATLFVLVYGHLAILPALSKRGKIITSAVAAVLVCSFLGVTAYSDHQKFSTEIKVQFSLKPLSKKWLFAKQPEKFFGALPALKTELDEDAKKKLADQ